VVGGGAGERAGATGSYSLAGVLEAETSVLLVLPGLISSVGSAKCHMHQAQTIVYGRRTLVGRTPPLGYGSMGAVFFPPP